MDLLRSEVNNDFSLPRLPRCERLGVRDHFFRIDVSEFDGFRLLVSRTLHGVRAVSQWDVQRILKAEKSKTNFEECCKVGILVNKLRFVIFLLPEGNHTEFTHSTLLWNIQFHRR